MVIRVFISGPIRPSMVSVQKVILAARAAFPSAIVSLCTWKTGLDTSALRAEVDDYIEVDEPDMAIVRPQITVRTQTDDRPDCAPAGWPWLNWRMMHGVNVLCEKVAPADEDILVRIRTDCVIRFDESELSRCLEQASRGAYVTWFAKMSGVMFTDWFAIASYGQFKKGWRLESIADYARMIENRYNPEDSIKTRLLQANVPLVALDMSKVDCFLYRSQPNGVITELRCT